MTTQANTTAIPKRGRRARWLWVGLLLPLWGAPAARAYEAETTLAGLTQQAALASRLHGALVDRFGRSQGLFDPLRLRLSQLDPQRAHSLRASLLRLDPAEGYAPEDLSAPSASPSSPAGEKMINRALRAPERQPALGWLMAGAVLESLPASRARHHFLAGASPAGAPLGLHLWGDEGRSGTSLSAVSRGLSTTRELLAGVAFDGTGQPATSWVESPENPLSLSAYRRAYRQAVLGRSEAEREGALVEALLAAGAVLALLGEMGDPAQVRNDPDALLGAGAYPLFVAQRYGRAGVPAPLPAAEAPQLQGLRLAQLFFSGSGAGLAERTARRFFSAGSLPGTARAQAAPRPSGVPDSLTLGPSPTLARPRPGVTRVPLGWPSQRSGYLGDREAPHKLAWQRLPAEGGEPPRLRFTQDERCYADQAAVLLPETGRYQVAALDLLLGADLRLSHKEGQLKISYGGALRRGQLTLLGEDKEGLRTVLRSVKLDSVAAGAPLFEGSLPAGIQRIAVLLEGQDAQDEALITSASLGL